MPKTIKIIGSGIVFLFGLGWRFLDLAGRGFALRDLKEMFPHFVEFLSRHQDIGYQIAPWAFMVAGTLFLIFLQWPNLLRVRRKSVKTEPSRSTAPIQQAAYLSTNSALLSTAGLSAPQFKNYAEINFSAAEQALLITTNIGTWTRHGPGDYTFNFYVPLNPEQYKYYASPPSAGVSITVSGARITFDETKNSIIFVGFGEKAKRH